MRLPSGGALKNTFAPLMLLLAVAFLQLASSPSWMYTPNQIDPWVYHGYFVHLRNHIAEFAGTYYGTRLAWILPGALLDHLLAPAAANLALRMLLYVVTLVSGFFLLRRSYGGRCAVLCCLLLTGDSYFLGAIGWDYVDGAGIAYLMLVLEELSAASQALAEQKILASWVRGCSAGFFYACAVHTNTLLLIFVPILALGFVVRSGINWRSVAIAPATIGGSALSTAALGLISRHLGGPFLFFLPSLIFMFSIGRHPNPWREPVHQWLPIAGWLVVPFAVTVLSLFCTLRWWRIKSGKEDTAYWRSRYANTSMIVATWILFTILQLGNSPMFQFYYVMSYVIPFAFVAAGAMIGRNLDAFSPRIFAVLVSVSAVLSLAIGTQSLHRLPSVAFRMIATPVPLQYSLLLLVLAGGVAVVLKHRWTSLALVGMAAWCWLVRVGAAVDQEDHMASRERYLAVDRTTHDLKKFMGQRQLYFWYSDLQSAPFVALTSTFLWGYRLIGVKMPDTSHIVMPLGVRLVMLAPSETAISEARAALIGSGYRLSPVAEWHEPTPGSGYEIGIFDVLKRRLPESSSVGKPVHAEPAHSIWIKRWLNGGLINDCEPNFYEPTGAIVVRPRLYRSENPADHVASRLVRLPNPASLGGVRIEADLPDFSLAYGGARLYLQDQTYRYLYDSGSMLEESLRVTVPVPPNVSAVRVIFVPNDDKYLIVSTNLSIGVVAKP
jgi:hypothetical protein